MELLNREEVTPAVVRPLENSSSMVCPKNVLDSGVIKGIQQVLKLKKKKKWRRERDCQSKLQQGYSWWHHPVCHPGRVCVSSTTMSEDTSYRTAASHGDLFNNHRTRTVEIDFKSRCPAFTQGSLRQHPHWIKMASPLRHQLQIQWPELNAGRQKLRELPSTFNHLNTLQW